MGDGLVTGVTVGSDVVTLTCTGSAETSAVADVEQALAGLYDEAVRRRAKQVVVDVTALEFASSSCLKAFATWLHLVLQLPPETRHAVRFVSSPRHAWQRRSLGALVAFAEDVASVEVVRP